MKKPATWQLLLTVLVTCVGCSGPSFNRAAGGRRVFAALQEAVNGAGRQVDPSLVLVKTQPEKGRSRRTLAPGVVVNMGGARPERFVGIVLTREGHVLVPKILKPDSDTSIQVWVGDEEFPARPVRVDDTLGMSLLKIEAGDAFTPLGLDNAADLAPGEWAVVRVPSDESTDFETFVSLCVCRGVVDGHYRRFMLNNLPREARGAPVVNVRGQVVGLAGSGDALSLNDLAGDLCKLVEKATDPDKNDDENGGKGWFGSQFLAINKAYARARDLPVSALWILKVASDGPAAAAGLKDGDLLVGLNGEPLRLTGNLVQDYFIKALRPDIGNPFSVTVIREGERLELSGTITKREDPEVLQVEDLGVTVEEINDLDVVRHNLFAAAGVRVTEVHQGSPAATSSSFGKRLLEKQDVILEVAGRPTPSIEEFAKVLEAVRGQKPEAVLVKYKRGRATGYAGLNMRIGKLGNGGGS